MFYPCRRKSKKMTYLGSEAVTKISHFINLGDDIFHQKKSGNSQAIIGRQVNRFKRAEQHKGTGPDEGRLEITSRTVEDSFLVPEDRFLVRTAFEGRVTRGQKLASVTRHTSWLGALLP